MADVKISALNALGTAPAAGDLLPVVDVSGAETKKLRIDELFTNPNVTGTLTADGLTVDGSDTVSIDTNATRSVLKLESSGTASRVAMYDSGGSTRVDSSLGEYFIRTGGLTTDTFAESSLIRFGIGSNGDISFYEDTGTTAKFFWDASAEQLAIGSNVNSTTPFTVNADTGSGGAVAFLRASGTDNNGVVIDVTNTPSNYIADFRVGNSSKVRIDSSGNVGIGTTSPTQPLHVYHPTTNGVANFQSGDANVNISLMDSATTAANYVGIGASGNNLTFISGNGSERARIDSSGNVGIGTTSPSSQLHMGQSGGAVITLQRTDSAIGTGWIKSANNAGTLGSAIQLYENQIRLYTTSGTSEAARIDSSGNLLIGKSSSAFGTQGVELQDDRIWSTTSQAATAYFNRLIDDGEIAKFYKDGTTVGSIGTYAGNPYFAGTSGGIGTGATSLYPTDSSGVATDNLRNLGAPTARFKDLYLSGGVYLGGTAGPTGDPNNYLDDYEEGTFTPVIQGGTTTGTGTYTTQYGVYTKTGDTVTFTAFIVWSAHSGSGVLLVGGLPFASNGSSNYRATFATYPSNISLSASHIAAGLMTANVTHILVRQLPVGGGADASVNLDTAGTIIISGSYKV